MTEPVRRLPREQRRAQILDAATRAFARTGYTATGLDDVAAEAGVTHVILYRHFASKNELYRAVLERARHRLSEAMGPGDFDGGSIGALLAAAAADPDGFRLLFRHAAREPEFRDVVDELRTSGVDTARRLLPRDIPDGPWREWAAQLTPVVALEAVIAWLDAGQPDPARAAARVRRALGGVIDAVRDPAAGPSTED